MHTKKAFGAALGAGISRNQRKKKSPKTLRMRNQGLTQLESMSDLFKTDYFRDSVKPDEPPVDYIVTGGVDDLVKVWELKEDRLVLKHKLEGHSLGVVSVAVSNNGKCTY